MSLPRANESLDGSLARETKEQTCLKLKRQVPSSSILREKMYVAGQVPSSSFLAGQVPSSSFLREKTYVAGQVPSSMHTDGKRVLETKLELRRAAPFMYRLYATACNGIILLGIFYKYRFGGSVRLSNLGISSQDSLNKYFGD